MVFLVTSLIGLLVALIKDYGAKSISIENPTVAEF
jgi:hypothetical protein